MKVAATTANIIMQRETLVVGSTEKTHPVLPLVLTPAVDLNLLDIMMMVIVEFWGPTSSVYLLINLPVAVVATCYCCGSCRVLHERSASRYSV